MTPEDVADKILDKAFDAYEGITGRKDGLSRHGVLRAVMIAIEIAEEEQRARSAKVVDDWVKAYPVSIFGDPPDGQHGNTVDSCSAKALRHGLPPIAEAIRQKEVDDWKVSDGL